MRNEKLIANVFPENSSFTVMMRLSDAVFMSVYERLGEYAKKIVDSRYPCSDGGLIHYRVTERGSLDDIKILLSVKCNGRETNQHEKNTI